MKKLTFKKVFYDFLKSSGHNPEFTENSDIFINFREGVIYFHFYNDDSRFYQSIYRFDFMYETENIKNIFYKAALLTNTQIKFAKICSIKEQKDENKGVIYVVVDFLIPADIETLKNQSTELKIYLDISLESTQEALNFLEKTVNEMLKEDNSTVSGTEK